ncbi:hypothetical protein PIROE2DRAFT_61856 [Piromyces sp. E2]|nr:hypothetical protein PIROE2DRAFT_61856 [Piromyces sp. E2]|eukprot:OUM62501.1 hypothetical protein PIROE2DRAFT_61856 [Piromyces sp. E2]
MRFSSTLLTIFVAISSLTLNVEGKIVKRGETEDKNEQVKQCQIGIEEYKECVSYKEKISKDNIENYCKVYNSEKCQKIFKDGIKSIKACEMFSQQSLKKTQTKFDTVNYTFKLLCAKDESNKFCPLSEVYITSGNSGFEKNGFDNYINETCKSKKCTDSAIEAFTILQNCDIGGGAQNTNNNGSEDSKTAPTANSNVKREVMEGTDAIDAIIKKLKAETCSSNNKNMKANAESSATTLIIGNTLLFTFVGLLLLILNN